MSDKIKGEIVSGLDSYVLQAETSTGTVESLGDIEIIDTKYGKREFVKALVNLGKAGSVDIRIWLGKEGNKTINVRSNTYKLMAKHNVKKLSQLVGKEVSLVVDSEGYYRWLV